MESSSSSSPPPNEEELRKKLIPDPTVEQVLEVVRKSFASPNSDIQLIKELDSYDDKNLWISIDGTYYLAKVHNGVESRDLVKLVGSDQDENAYQKAVIHLQNVMMMHLNEHGITANQPQKPLETTTINEKQLATPASIHSLPVVSKEDSPCPLVVRLLGWVPGRPMSTFPLLPIEGLADAGRFLGKLSVCLSSLSTETLVAAKRYHQWDGKNTLDLKNFVQYINDDRKRSMVESVIETFQKEIIDTNVGETQFQKSFIHGDFNDANFLLNDEFCVTGVIDFGDSVESWRILDLSVAMAYALLTTYGKKQRSLSAAAAMLRGYNSVCPLTPAERRHLLLLVACRLSCSVTLGAYSYQQNPGNEYLLLHATPAWDALDLIWGTDPDSRAVMRETIDKLFDRACSKTGSDDDSSSQVIDCSDICFPDPSISDPFVDVRAKGL